MTIPLDPGIGGQSIGSADLQDADIIVSTTAKLLSVAIKKATGAVVSHAMLYTGDDKVIEAIVGGVKLRSLGQALSDASLAVAYRYKGITDRQAHLVRNYALSQVGKGFNYLGLTIDQGGYQLDKKVFCLEANIECKQFYGALNMGTNGNKILRKDKFFCSQLVAAAFESAGVRLTQMPPHWNSPNDVANARLNGALIYIGHLRA